jgi:nitrile hydratase
VVTRHFHPVGHTRLPRYARGKRGAVHKVHGIHVFPDSNAHGQGEQPQPLYSVRFDAAELWGESAEPNAAVHLDLWECYLAPGGA